MRKLLSVMICVLLVVSAVFPVFAEGNQSSKIMKIDLDAIVSSGKVLSEAEYYKALKLIEDKSDLVCFEGASEANSKRLLDIEKELSELGVVDLPISDVRSLLGTSNTRSTPTVPGNTNHVSFYGMSTNCLYNGISYDVFSIVAYSSGMGQLSGNYTLPLYKQSSQRIVDFAHYQQADFDKVIDLISYIGHLFPAGSFTATLLSELPSMWTIAEFFGGSTTTQAVDTFYAASQLYIYSYVSVAGSGVYDFAQTAERISYTYYNTYLRSSAGTITSDTAESDNRVFVSDYYADYQHAVSHYCTYHTQAGYTVGSVMYRIGGTNKITITMPYYNSPSNIPSY